jgi:hypothetical protein
VSAEDQPQHVHTSNAIDNSSASSVKLPLRLIPLRCAGHSRAPFSNVRTFVLGLPAADFIIPFAISSLTQKK